jgi:alanine racemase
MWPAIKANAVGYGDGLSRKLSNRIQVVVGGGPCRQVGRITMDQTLVDVTSLSGRVRLGSETHPTSSTL